MDTKDSSRPRATRITLVTLAVYALAENAREMFIAIPAYRELRDGFPEWLRWLEYPVSLFMICVAALMLTYRFGPMKALREMGLAAPILPALAFGIAATAPMWLVPLILPQFAFSFDAKEELFNALVWPLGEEILYRGYLFLQLYRRAGWPFWKAAGLSSLIFGAVHLGNAVVRQQPIGEQIGTVAMLTVLTIFGAWILIRWDGNLWVMTAGHGMMNLWWSTFHLGDSPLGGWPGNAMRIATIGLAVLLTIYRQPIARRLRHWTGRTKAGGEPATAPKT